MLLTAGREWSAGQLCMTAGLSSVNANISMFLPIRAFAALVAAAGSYHEFIQVTSTVESLFAAFIPKVKALMCRMTSGIGNAPTYPAFVVFDK